MKFTSIFYKASAAYIRLKSKDTNKRAENMKFTSIFYKASAAYIRLKSKDNNKRAIKAKFILTFYSECRKSSSHHSMIPTSERY